MASVSRLCFVLSKYGPLVHRNRVSRVYYKHILSVNSEIQCRHNHNMCKSGGSYLANTKTLLGPLACHINHRLRLITTGRAMRAQEPWMISDYEVNSIIAAQETSGEINEGIIGRFEANQLGANNPIEDRKFIAKLKYEEGGYLFGVLDGHGGDQCARSVCQRISNYIALNLMNSADLNEFISIPKLVEYICMSSNEYHDYSYIDNQLCQKNIYDYFLRLQQEPSAILPPIKSTILRKQKTRVLQVKVDELLESQLAFRGNALVSAFNALDEDISQEGLYLNEQGQVDQLLFKAANSGACTLVAHLNGTELCIANTGDCRAVLGTQNPDNSWSAIQLSSDHTAGNPEEVERIVNEHPLEEATTCIQYERLLRRLAPLRAFGDVRFKWDTETQKRIFKQFPNIPHFTEKEHFFTPPYLTAEPEITTYQLQRSDKFLVLATDGLWDLLSSEEVVEFVKDHLEKRDSPPINKEPYQVTFNEQELPSELTNSASCLIRQALGGDDHFAVSSSLHIPYPDTRKYRDDMTVLVVFFDWDQLEIPSEGEDAV